MPVFAPEKLAAWTGGRWTRSPGGALGGFSQDTRTLNAGQVFVALKTGRRDGHAFLGEAQGRGAAAALVAHDAAGSNLPQLVVPDPLAAFQAIAREHRRGFPGKVIGVTGSVGKTSTKDLLALLLGGAVVAGVSRACGTGPASPGPATAGAGRHVLATEGNLNNHIGVPLTLTRLDPAIHQFAVIEAGINTPGEMAGLAAMIEPDHAIVTLVGAAHLEGLGSLAGVAREKSALLSAARPGGCQVFPVSCWQFPPFRELANPLVLVPADGKMAPVTGRTVTFTVFHRPGRTEVALDRRRPFILRRVSGGMAQNAALALTLASELGVSDAALQERLARWTPARWRGEMQRHGSADVYCDFYNANPASMADAIAAFDGLAPADRPRLFVLGGMEELGAQAADFHRQAGRTILLRPGDFLFALGDHAAALRAGLLENGNDPAQIAIIADLAPVRERLAGFRGAVFLKGSRRWRLETALEPATAENTP